MKKNAAEAQPSRKLNALEQSKLEEEGGPKWLSKFMVFFFMNFPGVNRILGLQTEKLNFHDRELYFNSPLPEELLDSHGVPKAHYSSNKVRTTKYTPLTFLPKNIIFQFQNVANIYFLMVAIFSGFSIFGVNNAGLASVPIIAIVVVTALRDGVEDWRRQVLDLELNNTLTVVLKNLENPNTPIGRIGAWRRFKKACSKSYRRMWYSLARKEDPLIDVADVSDKQSITSIDANHNAFDETKPHFERDFWKNVRVGDIVKVYADDGVPADMVILSSSDPEGDCFIDTRNLDGESSLKARKALNSTKHIRRAWQLAEMQFKFNIEGASADLDSFGFNYTDLNTNLSEALIPMNFLPRGATVRNSRWVIGYVVYTGAESKIMLNSGETPTKRSRLARELNFYVAVSFIFLFILCFVSGVVEGVMFERKKNNLAYYFENGLQTKNAALNGFVTFFAAMLVLQNLVPISLYVTIEIARTLVAWFMYSDPLMYDEETDYPCTPKSWALGDDLGQIEYIFSDKTGTLTQNSMVFRKCTINGLSYGTCFTESMAGQLKRKNEDVDSIRAEMDRKIFLEKIRMNRELDAHYRNPYIVDFPELVSEPLVADMAGAHGEEQCTRIEQFALTLALCNTVVVDSRKATPLDVMTKTERASLISNTQLTLQQINDAEAEEAAAAGTSNRPRNFSNSSASEVGAPLVDLQNSAAGMDGDELDMLHLPMPFTAQGAPAAAFEEPIRTNTNPRMSTDSGSRDSGSRNSGQRSRPSLDSYRSSRSRGRSHTRNRSSFSINSNDLRGPSLDLKRTRTAEVFGGYGRKSVSSARPKKSLDYHRMEGKVLLHKAESPDESALVTMARDIGYTLVEDSKHSKVVDMQGTFHRFHIFQSILFSSQRKRMSVVVKNEAGRCFILVKGADSVIETLLSEKSKNSKVFSDTMHQLEQYGEEGLRTLMIAYKELDPKFAETWSDRYEEASCSSNRDELMEQLAAEVECDLNLIGGTGIEDQLQIDVPETIEILARAGIKLWMLTGDKVETAISIGFSCNLLDPSMELLIVKKSEELSLKLAELGLEVNEKTLKEAANDHNPPAGRHALIIDGRAISELVSNPELRLQFALLGKKCRSVLCCRVSPSQKAAVVHIMRSTFDVMSVAVGDGANDVSMIQEADVGVGIVGVEGRQAAMSSDFAIGQFSFLQRLLLIHGRWSYLRVSSMIKNLLFQNFMFSLTLFWYNIFAQYDQSYLYDYTYLTLFNSFFVAFSVTSCGILDQDLPDYVLLRYPELYASGILRTAWTKAKFFGVMLDGLYQSAVCYFFAYSIFFNGKFYTLGGIDIAYRQGMGVLACATAVFTCNYYVLMDQYRWDWISVLVFIISNGFYFAWTGIYTCFIASNFFYRSAEVVYDTLVFWAYFLLSLTTCNMPRYIYYAVQHLWFPTDVDIIREDYHNRRKTNWWNWLLPRDEEAEANEIENQKVLGTRINETDSYTDDPPNYFDDAYASDEYLNERVNRPRSLADSDAETYLDTPQDEPKDENKEKAKRHSRGDSNLDGYADTSEKDNAENKGSDKKIKRQGSLKNLSLNKVVKKLTFSDVVSEH